MSSSRYRSLGMYFPVIPLDGLSTRLSVSDCFEPSSRSTPARDLTSLHTTIRADFLLSFTFILSLSFLPSCTGVRGAGADGTEFLMPTTEITLHLYTLFPTRENYSPLPSTGSPYLVFLPHTSKAYPPSSTRWGKQPHHRLSPYALYGPIESTHTHPIRIP